MEFTPFASTSETPGLYRSPIWAAATANLLRDEAATQTDQLAAVYAQNSAVIADLLATPDAGARIAASQQVRAALARLEGTRAALSRAEEAAAPAYAAVGSVALQGFIERPF